MGTVRIGGVVKGGPSTQFWLEADWVQKDDANNRSLLRVWLRTANGPSGNSDSRFLAEGYQNAHANGYLFEVRRNPFLPSGFGQNQTRWHESRDRWFGHDSNGNGPSVSLGMELGYGGISDRYDNGRAHTGSIGAPSRIGRAPGKTPRPSVSNITARGLRLAWSAASRGHADIVEYQVQRATNSAFSGAVAASAGNNRAIDLETLNPGTDYWFRVRARNGDGWGEWSDAVAARTLSGAYVGKGGSFPSAEVRVGKGGSFVLAASVQVGKGGSFVNAG